jgi:putative ABC transport system permease protein
VLMDRLLQDFRFTVRQWRKNPGFALTTMLTLALGIGATTAIFSLVNTILLRPLAFPQPERLMHVGQRPTTSTATELGPGNVVLSYPDYFDLRSQNHSFEALAAYHDNNYTLTGAGDPQHIDGFIVSAEFFRVLGVNPALGRGLVADDEKPGARVVVLSHRLWQSSFGANPDIVGHAINIDSRSYTVVGVMPKDFSFPIQNPEPALWTSLADDAVDPGGDQPMTIQRGAHMLDAIGRLKPGVTPAQALADLGVITGNLARQYPESNKKFAGAYVVPELENLVGDTRPALRVLFAAVGFVLLIACVNVAGLLLARTSRRRSEMAVRAALGATRAELIRQVLFESVALSLAGGFLGVALSVGLLRSVLQFVPRNLPRLDQVSVDGQVLAFAIAVSVLTGILFGVLPAWRMSRLDPSLALREGSRSLNTGRGQHRLHDSLVIAETAIGLILLIGAGLLIHSFMRILRVDPGFDSHHILTAAVALPDNNYNGQQQVQFYRQLLPRLAALPGVQSVGAGWSLPFSTNGMHVGFEVEGHALPPGDRPAAGVYVVTPEYFQTLRIPILRGRPFRPEDTAKSGLVVAVNETFARKYFPNEDPIGKRLQIGLGDGTVDSKSWREIVAVISDIKNRKLTTESKPEYYLPYAQAAVLSPSLVIRTAGDPVTLIAPVRAQLAQMDKTVPLYEVKTMEDMISQASAQPRFQTLLITLFAVMALLLSAIGLYAVLSYMVAQRSMEIGLRMAVGAQRIDVLSLVLRRGLLLAGAGLGIGIVASLVLTRFLEGMLYGVRSFDPLTFVVVSGILLLVALAASSAPAYRAARLDPMNTLREQ